MSRYCPSDDRIVQAPTELLLAAPIARGKSSGRVPRRSRGCRRPAYAALLLKMAGQQVSSRTDVVIAGQALVR